MKYYGSILDFTSERNDDLMRAYYTQLAKSDYIIMPEIFSIISNSPAKRFWVSEERAAIVISAMLAGRSVPHNMHPNKRQMYDEIFRRFLLLRKSRPNDSVYQLVSEIVNQPAPKFYLTPRTVGEIIYRIKKGWYDRQYDRYRKDKQPQPGDSDSL